MIPPKPLKLDVALDKLMALIEPIAETETIDLVHALGRVLAKDVVAAMNVPPHDNSAVDGYAVRHADLASGGATTRLPVTARIAAGHPLDRAMRPGEAIRIFTGAPMPRGADTVIMQEHVSLDGEQVILPADAKKGANRRRAGEDVAAGTVVLGRGIVLGPQEMGVAASVGAARLVVARRLRVAVFSTGDEVRDPGDDLPPGGIYDANRFTLMGLLAGMGCAVTDLGILPDRFEAIRDALDQAARGHDLLVTSGGVSLGEEDHVKAAVEALGSLDLWRLAIKPGRPLAFGRIGTTPLLGLPGNPVAAMVTFMRIGRPLVQRRMGRAAEPPPLFKVRAGFTFDHQPGRIEWLRARLDITADGPVARKFAADGSGILTSMVEADGLVEISEATTHIKLGDWVDFLPFNEVVR